MYIKEVEAKNASLQIGLQKTSAEYNFSPKIFTSEWHGTRIRIYMEDVGDDTLANLYGENVPEWIWNEIRYMIKTLFENEGIEYIAITPSNFIEKDNRIYIIDFDDAKYTDGDINWFLSEFLKGENSWNPEYK